MTRTSSLQRAGLVICVIGLLALGFGYQYVRGQAPSAAVSVASGGLPTVADALAAPAQSALDRILGPGRSVVTASATYSAASSRLTTSYQGKQVAPLAQARASGPGYGSSVTQNGVGQTVTRSNVVGGQVQRLSVAVVVDSALRPAPNLVTIRALVSAALGLQPSRGDTLSVVALPLPSHT
jgi:flagellar M-ring protein FliF